MALKFRGGIVRILDAFSPGSCWPPPFLTDYDVLALKTSWDDQWIRAAVHVDLDSAWTVLPHLTLRASAENMLRTNFYWSNVGKHDLAISDIVDSGRTFRLSAVYAF